MAFRWVNCPKLATTASGFAGLSQNINSFFKIGFQVGELPKNGDGGKWVCGLRTLLQRKECVIYSFGSNGEASFEKGILAVCFL